MLSNPCFIIMYTSSTKIYTLSLHDALPIFQRAIAWAAKKPLDALTTVRAAQGGRGPGGSDIVVPAPAGRGGRRSEEHTSELQSQSNLVCRLLLVKINSFDKINTLLIMISLR